MIYEWPIGRSSFHRVKSNRQVLTLGMLHPAASLHSNPSPPTGVPSSFPSGTPLSPGFPPTSLDTPSQPLPPRAKHRSARDSVLCHPLFCIHTHSLRDLVKPQDFNTEMTPKPISLPPTSSLFVSNCLPQISTLRSKIYPEHMSPTPNLISSLNLLF